MTTELWIGLATIVAGLLLALAKLVLPRINKRSNPPPAIQRGPELTPSPVATSSAADATGPFLASYVDLPATPHHNPPAPLPGPAPPPPWAQGILDAVKGQEELTATLARQLGAGEPLATKDDLEDLRESINTTLAPISTTLHQHEIQLALLHERTKN
jgi:hypothetical protein